LNFNFTPSDLPLETGSVFLGLYLEGGGNHSQLAIPFNGGLGRVVGHGGREGSHFLFSVLLKPPSFGKFFPFTETYKLKCKYLAFTLAFTPCKL